MRSVEWKWRKSTRSSNGGDTCVECSPVPSVLAERTGATVGVRDSKDPDGPKLLLRSAAFGALLRDIKSGALDL